MKKITVLFVIVTLCAGCSRKDETPESNYVVVSVTKSHKITMFVNDEPVFVCQGQAGDRSPLWTVFRKGKNQVRFSVERLPKEERDNPGCPDGNSTIEIIKGNIFAPTTVFAWEATEDSQTSSIWSVEFDDAFRPSLDEFDDIGVIDENTKTQIAAFFDKLENAFKNKDLSTVGFTDADFKSMFGDADFLTDLSLKDVFDNEPYHVAFAPMTMLKIIHGKKTIMVYRPDGKRIFYAGLSPSASPKPGTCSISMGQRTFYFVKKNGKLEPLWPKRYK